MAKTHDSSDLDEVTAFQGPQLTLEEPIYRFFPLFFFQDAVSRKRLVFANPSEWQDPYEFLARDFWKRDSGGNIIGRYQIPFNRAFAMCWSSAEDSDPLLRAYSNVVKDRHCERNIYPQMEGVKVRSTAKKVLTLFEVATVRGLVSNTEYTRSRSYINRVRYDKNIARRALFFHQECEKDNCDQNETLANILFLKRDSFTDEKEIRAVMIVKEDPIAEDTAVALDFEPNYLFDEIVFDPRLSTDERNEREADLRRRGFIGKVTTSGIYARRNWTD